MLTTEQKKLISQGFGHMVDSGYSQIKTVEDVIRVLEVSLERAKREKLISENIDLEKNPNADLIISFLEPTIENLNMRMGA